jgi:A/G-specific adenine glycosylase
MTGITNKLMHWYSEFKRPLPWRDSSDPYKIWLSEIILQQTRVEQGLAYYLKFVTNYPEIEQLAKADERDVLKLWEGLGYYSRARNLHKASKYIVDNCNAVFPDNYNALLKLNGVGPYTAAAIASIVFNEPVVAIDGNVLRVASRLFLISAPIDKAKTHSTIRIILNDFIDDSNPGDFNQAMMELGAIICSPKNPKCNICPVKVHCLAFEKQKQNTLPVKSGTVKVKKLFFNYLVPEYESKTLIIKKGSGIWIGLYQFPLFISDNNLLDRNEIEKIIYKKGFANIYNLSASPVIKHVLTHRNISVCFWTFNTDSFSGFDKIEIVEKSKLANYPMPQLMVNFIRSNPGY